MVCKVDASFIILMFALFMYGWIGFLVAFVVLMILSVLNVCHNSIHKHHAYRGTDKNL